eukprot:CAMPEP_0119033398 /NCGR_PEP_ID=MMETSP1177-20130426/442_1 /TAXON_ID=2985 /ORGANISM="Ochromonas sp, Strain CCMP1899" /LENGTH=195 /DNA_ID=CAMNT_0006990119 /DNA_START=152 /DNA_END=736 /DNA_ORIENTATION=-
MGGIICKPLCDTFDKDSVQTSLASISGSSRRKQSFKDEDFTDCPLPVFMGIAIKSRLLFRDEIRNSASNKNKWIWKPIEVIGLDAPDKVKIHFEGESAVHDKWLCLSVDGNTALFAPLNLILPYQMASGGALDDSQNDIAVFYLITGKFPTDDFSSELDELENIEPMDTHYFTGQKIEVRDTFKSKTDGSIIEKW